MSWDHVAVPSRRAPPNNLCSHVGFVKRRKALFEIRKSQFVNKSKGKLGMLKHMIEAQVLNLVLCCVDFVVRVLEV